METFEEQLAAAYGMASVADLYYAVTGAPIWLDPVGREFRAAQRKWAAFLTKCRAAVATSV